MITTQGRSDSRRMSAMINSLSVISLFPGRVARPESTHIIRRAASMEMDLGVARQALEKGIAFVGRTGLVVEELKRGYVRCRMPYAGNGNHIGTMYAGALFT